MSDLSRPERSAIWAQMDLAVNILSISIGLFATGRIVGRFGMPGNHCTGSSNGLYWFDNTSYLPSLRRRNDSADLSAVLVIMG